MEQMHSAELMFPGCLLNRILVYSRIRGFWYTEVYKSHCSRLILWMGRHYDKKQLREDRVCLAHFSRSQSAVGDAQAGPLATAEGKHHGGLVIAGLLSVSRLQAQ